MGNRGEYGEYGVKTNIQVAPKLSVPAPNWSLPFAKAHVFKEYVSLTDDFLPDFKGAASFAA